MPAGTAINAPTARPMRRNRHDGPGVERILLVDDEDVFLASIRRHLSREGFDLAVARNGREACRVIDARAREGRPIDLIITDMIMPEMGGMELLQRVQAVHADISVILLTGFGESDAVARAIRTGQDAYGSKPITPRGAWP